MSTTERLNELFIRHHVKAKVTGATVGPTITRYDVTVDPGTRVENVLRLRKTIEYTLGTEHLAVRAPVEGRSVIGLELPSDVRGTVRLADLQLVGAHPLTIPLGVDIDARMITACLAHLPHLLVAGATGGGKSNFVNATLVTLLERVSPAVLQLVLIDLKRVELAPYRHVPHLMCPVITEAPEAAEKLASLVEITDERYRLLEDAGVRNLDAYNTKVTLGLVEGDVLPYIVVVVDELAELLMAEKEAVEDAITRLTQKARACGIHLLVATQRPSHDIVSGKIKVNIPGRVAFAVPKNVDSRVIIDTPGAEKLLGAGDGLFTAGGKVLRRFQGALVSDAEVEHAVSMARWAWGEPVWAAPAPVPAPAPVVPAFATRPAWVGHTAPQRPAPSAPVSGVSGTLPANMVWPVAPAQPPVAPARPAPPPPARERHRWWGVGQKVCAGLGVVLALFVGLLVLGAVLSNEPANPAPASIVTSTDAPATSTAATDTPDPAPVQAATTRPVASSRGSSSGVHVPRIPRLLPLPIPHRPRIVPRRPWR